MPSPNPNGSDTPNRDQFAEELQIRLWRLYNEANEDMEIFMPAAADLVCFLFDRVVASTVDMAMDLADLVTDEDSP